MIIVWECWGGRFELRREDYSDVVELLFYDYLLIGALKTQ